MPDGWVGPRPAGGVGGTGEALSASMPTMPGTWSGATTRWVGGWPSNLAHGPERGRASRPRRRVMGNYAAVDCGTLSTRLLISDPQGQPIIRLTRVTGLGEGVDRSRVVRAEAAERTLTVFSEYRQLMDRHGVSATRMVGTSALRDAANRASFADAAGEVIGAPLMLLARG